MKNIFERPEMQIIFVGNCDIITASGTTNVETYGHEVWTPWLDLEI